MDDWLVGQINLLGIPVQNWMLVTLALALVAALINIAENSEGG